MKMEMGRGTRNRSLTASDAALYTGEAANYRILNAALTFASEEAVPLP
jgi:hypothetical protein